MAPTIHPPSRLLLWGFRRYLPAYFRRHFHAVAVSYAVPLDVPAEAGLVVYANHASWWDPLVALLLAPRIFPERTLFAPIEAAAAQRYRILRHMGFFGVERQSSRGAAQFLRTAQAVLEQPGGSLWMTPEGRFTDPRDTDAPFAPGLAHLAVNVPSAVFVPVALEYPFWEERLPEVLVHFGEPLGTSGALPRSKEQWNTQLQQQLRRAQQQLADYSVARNSAPFQVVLRGRGGTSRVYDTFRRVYARLTRQTYRAEHGSQLR